MKNAKRTLYCGEATKEMLGQEVVVCGWVAKQRDLGGNLIFIDLRDRSGILQLAFDQNTERTIFDCAFALRSEFVVGAKGVLRKRSAINKQIPTGELELFVTDLEIFAKSQTPPFEISGKGTVSEENRLRYRYLDLRRTEMQETLIARHKIAKLARDYFDTHRFVEIETPILIKSTPEGARDYLVPSRVHPGKFYALPQSPQLYKQLTMLAGFDRYMQIARCFRDEDLRADRQPEFTQIDLEMSFVDEQDVQEINEGLMKLLYKEILDKELSLPLPRISYKDAMERFGSDKPDTRFGLEIVRLDTLLKDTGFTAFAGALSNGGSVRAINVKAGAAALTRKEIDKLTEVAKLYKAKGLAYTRITAEGSTSSFEKFMTQEEILSIYHALDLQTGDVLLIVADTNDEIVSDALGQVRLAAAARCSLIPADQFDLLWVTDFPLLEYDPEDGRYYAKHHPFTAPHIEDLPLLDTDPARVRARAYDLVLNGTELGGGSIRISDPAVQSKMFAVLGMSEQESYERFGFLLDAFKYGVPPHGGMAYGLDRLVMLLLGKDSIRDVIAFPKVQNASELMTACPSSVESKNLAELHIEIARTE